MGELVQLRAQDVGMIVDVSTGAPTILHWGAPVDDPAAVAAALEPPLLVAGLDVSPPLTLVPLHADGFPGRPGLLGSREDGTAWAPRFTTSSWAAVDGGLTVTAVDDVAGLRLDTNVHLDATGVLRAQAAVTNAGASRYRLDQLTVTFPIAGGPGAELVVFDGRWARELHPRRQRFEGAWLSENRRGRTSHDHPPLVWAGAAGFGEWHGDVWGLHLAWSGNSTVLAERLGDGRRYVQMGSLLHPGEIVLDPGESYATPWVVGAFSSSGMTAASHAFHRHVRSFAVHPTRPRPVLCNTWEAVYFDHDQDRLRQLASTAASVGVERFVLDDGWFGGRRNDSAGLGDWDVSPDVYPEGLGPLITHVRSLGMEFGLWVEPEMVNPDSALYRAHPDWVLATPGYEPVLGRNQLVLDLARPAVFDHLLGVLHALLRDNAIAYLKWDMNRDHVAGSGADRRAGTSAQTHALYRLLDELRARHPTVEIESCASGGGRVDLGILHRTERVWASDCNDALERQTINRSTSMLLPPELIGMHIGPPTAHTTGRRQSLAFRAATALFGHLGVEWDLLRASPADLDGLRDAIAIHKRLRPLLHGGDLVRFDPPGAWGVYAPDRREAVVGYAQLATELALAPAPLRLPGLDPSTVYDVTHVPLAGERWGLAARHPAWLRSGLSVSGATLAAAGVQLPALLPSSAVILHLAAR